MPDIGIDFLLALMAGCIGLLTFFFARQSSARKDGERWGKLERTLEELVKEINEVKVALAETTRNTRQSLERLHKRLDNHIKNGHRAIPRGDGEEDVL